MRQSFKKILVELNRRRKPVATSKLAEEVGLHPDGIYRSLKVLEQKGLVSKTIDGIRTQVAITKAGKTLVKTDPEFLRDEENKEGKASGGGGSLSDAQKLWKGCGLKHITLSADYHSYVYENGVAVYAGESRRFDSVQKATAYVAARRGKTNLFFTPAATSLLKVKSEETVVNVKQFQYSQVLWLDMDMRQSSGEALPQKERVKRINERLQEIVNDKLPVFAVVDSGGGYHIYFRVQNKIKNEERLERALRGLAKIYGADIKGAATKATAFLRVPGTTNIKESASGKSLRAQCKLYDYKPENRCRLEDIEALLNINAREERRQQYKYDKNWDWMEDLKKTKAERRKHKYEWLDEIDFTETETREEEAVPTRKRANLSRIIKDGYDEERRIDYSDADYWFMCEAIRQGHTREEIFGWMMDKKNGICIYRRGGKNRDERYLERTFGKAEGDVEGEE